MRLIKSAHAVYRTQFHIVWVTRFRRKILKEGVAKYLETKLQEVRKYYPDWEYIAIGAYSGETCHPFRLKPATCL